MAVREERADHAPSRAPCGRDRDEARPQGAAVPVVDTGRSRSRGAPMLRAAPADRAELRVMHLVFALQPGGMELGVVKLVNGLDRRGVRSSICSTRPAGALKSLLAPDVPLFELSRR